MPTASSRSFGRIGNRAAVLVILVAWSGLQPGQAAEPAPPRPRDVWYVYVAGDQRWGYEHVTVRRQEDGTFSYEVETRMLLDLLGQQQEMTEKGKYIVTAFVALGAGLPAVFSPAMLMEIRSAKFKTMFQNYEVLKNEDYGFNRMAGRMLVFRRAGRGEETGTMKATEVMWSDGTSCYLLNLIADEKSHDEHTAVFFKLLASFETLPRAPATKTEKEKAAPQ